MKVSNARQHQNVARSLDNILFMSSVMLLGTKYGVNSTGLGTGTTDADANERLSDFNHLVAVTRQHVADAMAEAKQGNKLEVTVAIAKKLKQDLKQAIQVLSDIAEFETKDDVGDKMDDVLAGLRKARAGLM